MVTDICIMYLYISSHFICIYCTYLLYYSKTPIYRAPIDPDLPHLTISIYSKMAKTHKIHKTKPTNL